eukprot:scaffold100742_cov63-Phaeocystis_antarctica.AAC.2
MVLPQGAAMRCGLRQRRRTRRRRRRPQVWWRPRARPTFAAVLVALGAVFVPLARRGGGGGVGRRRKLAITRAALPPA